MLALLTFPDPSAECLYRSQVGDDESCKFLTTLLQVGFSHEEIFNKLLYHKRTLNAERRNFQIHLNFKVFFQTVNV